jgi:hypothetical protein
MVVVILVDAKLSIGGEVKQAFHRFNFLNREMIELALQLPKEQSARGRPRQNQ